MSDYLTIVTLVENTLKEQFADYDYEVIERWLGCDALEITSDDPSSVGSACASVWREYVDFHKYKSVKDIRNITLTGPKKDIFRLKHNKATICWIRLLPKGEASRRQEAELEIKKRDKIKELRNEAMGNLFWTVLWLLVGLLLNYQLKPLGEVSFLWRWDTAIGEFVEDYYENDEYSERGSSVSSYRIYKYKVNGYSYKLDTEIGDLGSVVNIDYFPNNPGLSRISGLRGYILWFAHAAFRILLTFAAFYTSFTYAKSFRRSLKMKRTTEIEGLDKSRGNQISRRSTIDELNFENEITESNYFKPTPERLSELNYQLSELKDKLKKVPPAGSSYNEIVNKIWDIESEISGNRFIL